MPLRKFAEWWTHHKAGLDGRLLYLKDWHFVSEFPDYQVRLAKPLLSSFRRRYL